MSLLSYPLTDNAITSILHPFIARYIDAPIIPRNYYNEVINEVIDVFSPQMASSMTSFTTVRQHPLKIPS